MKPDEFSRLIEGVELKKVHLLSYDGRRELKEPLPGEIDLKIEESFEHHVPTDREFVYIASYHLHGEQEGRSIVNIRCEFASIFKNERKLPEEFFEPFLQSVRIICHPYLRQHVSSMTGDMDLPKLYLPTQKTYPPKSKKKRKTGK